MIITDNHELQGEHLIHRPLPGGVAMNNRRFLVIHFTAGASGASSVEFWKSPQARGASAHLVIERDGSIIQCRPFNRTCGHAGKSQWRDPNSGKIYIGLNSNSIGIELANAGADDAALSWARKQPGFQSLTARHKHGGPSVEWEKFPLAQLIACELVAKLLVARYHLDDIVGHDDIAPERKTDPGPAFPMLALREACEFHGMPKP